MLFQTLLPGLALAASALAAGPRLKIEIPSYSKYSLIAIGGKKVDPLGAQLTAGPYAPDVADFRTNYVEFDIKAGDRFDQLQAHCTIRGKLTADQTFSFVPNGPAGLFLRQCGDHNGVTITCNDPSVACPKAK